LADVTLAPGKRGTVVLHAVPRPGADPLMEAAAGQLKEGCDPYRLVLPAERETLAEYYRDELRAVLTPRDEPSDRFLVTAPEGPQSFKAYDGKASFDGRSEVSFRWSWSGASSEKWKAGDQTFPVRELSGVEWRSPDVFDGYLRLLPRSAEPRPVHESLPFAAAVLSAVRRAGRVAALPEAELRDPAGVAERIRHLGELHEAGLVTDQEFTAKQAELLAEL
jgi:hypothetical protein